VTTTPTHTDVFDLLGALCDGTITPQQHEQLERELTANSVARQLYFEYLDLHLDLRRWPWDIHPDGDPRRSSEGQSDAAERDIADSAFVPPPVLVLDADLHGTAGYFSSGWPVAYAIATAIVVGGLIVGALVHVSQPEQIVRHPASRPTAVGRITGMVDCVWEGSGTTNLPSPARGRGAGGEGGGKSDSPLSTLHSPLIRLGDTFALRSGLVEITYKTGAKVILQGPVTYQVETPNGGFMSAGKLTGKVKVETAKGFAVRTPTATVTDLGTEFGIEVDKQGDTISHVFRGVVRVQRLGASMDKDDDAVVLHENESVQTKKVQEAEDAEIVLRRVNVDPRVFMRRLTKQQTKLDVCDIVTGGDGRTRHRFNQSAETEGIILVSDARASKPLRFPATDMIDRVFWPAEEQKAVQLDSAGHTFNGFPKTASNALGSVWTTPSGVSAHGRATPKQGSLLGLHSNAGITFDLKAVRERYAGMRPNRFRSGAFCGSSAGSATLFHDDFQSTAAGTMPRDARLALSPVVADKHVVGNWWEYSPHCETAFQLWNNVNPGKPTNDAGANNYLKVQLDKVNPGPLYAMGWGLNHTADMPVELTFSVWKDSTMPAWCAVTGVGEPIANGTTINVFFFSNGTVFYHDGDNMVATGLTYQTDAWQEVKIKADLATQTFSLTIGRATVNNLHWNYGANALNYVCFSNGGEGQFFIDDVRLTALAGLSESQRRGFGKAGRGDLWVFVDGRLRLARMGLGPQEGVVPVDIELGPDDRFLTLASTDDGNLRNWDWIVFSDPVLEMTASEGLDSQ
jgi:hypothetical protein